MLAEFGHFSLMLSFCFSLLILTLPVYGLFRNNLALQQSVRTLVFGQWIFIAISLVVMVLLIIKII